MATSPDRHRIAGEYLDKAKDGMRLAAGQLAEACDRVNKTAENTVYLVTAARAHGWTDKEIAKRLGIARRELRALIRNHPHSEDSKR